MYAQRYAKRYTQSSSATVALAVEKDNRGSVELTAQDSIIFISLRRYTRQTNNALKRKPSYNR